MAALLVGTAVFGLGGWRWAPAIVYFFISSSLLSKIGESRKVELGKVFQKGSRRDWGQVLANGLIPALCAFCFRFSSESTWYLLYLSALSSATADTWGTEIGVMAKVQPVHMVSGYSVTTGTSGGITTFGTLASLTGAVTLSIVGALFEPSQEETSSVILFVTVSGFMASLCDSFLGGTLQAQYRCPVCGKRTERRFHCAAGCDRVSGLGWMNNDLVNLLSGLLATGLIFLLIKG
jgi:uncharacterized protein (TIGR00297 family)